MLTEKLFLHVLIILMPILIYYAIFEKKKLTKAPYLIGVLHGVSAFFCMIFAYNSYGLNWDLRYVPLVLAAIYGGPRAGGIVFVVIVLTRTLIGGDALLFGYVSAFLACSVPLIFANKFLKIHPKKRKKIALLYGFWPALIQLFILITYMIISEIPIKDTAEIMLYICVFGLIQIVAVGFAATLFEAIIEKQLMKEEMNRSEKLHTLGELAASIAHEVRNPLTVVKGFLQLMKETSESKADHHQYLSLVLSELGRAEAIISDYLNFAKPQLEMLQELELKEVLQEIVLLLEPLATKQGVILQHEIETSVKLITDRNKLKQALVNIVKNAIEATDDTGKVFIELKLEQTNAVMIIQDTGKGMSKEQLSRIGTLFYTTKDKGTGLGTMVSLRIIEAMNGKVLFSSELGVGTKVTIRLPISSTTEER
ncbi:ATP-binding protein [Bacillus salitolerans]|uniref:histidine kinase n=1 Tax=Bacillus salitolerans TaxID=1437434 RepID=A0ABW4LVW3_9BACI